MPYPEAVALTEDERKHVSLVSGSMYPAFAEEVAGYMGTVVDPMAQDQFPNTEVYARYLESARGKHVIAVQSLAAREGWSVNDGLIELGIMTSAARGASAEKITAVVPHLAYARQDRKAKGREPVSIQYILDLIALGGVNRIVTVDPHVPQVQIGFHGPFDQLTAEPLLHDALVQEIMAHEDDYMIMAPDAGRAGVAEEYSNNLSDMTDAEKMGRFIGFSIMGKRRIAGKVRHTAPAGVKDKNCIVIDDMIDTAGTLVSATDMLHEAGAKRVVVAATHGLFSGDALDKLKASKIIKQIIVTNTVPMDRALEELGADKLKVLSIAPLVGRALVEIVTNGSVSQLFERYRQYK